MAITVTFSQGLRINLLDTKPGKNCKIFFKNEKTKFLPKINSFPKWSFHFNQTDNSPHLKCQVLTA